MWIGIFRINLGINICSVSDVPNNSKGLLLSVQTFSPSHGLLPSHCLHARRGREGQNDPDRCQNLFIAKQLHEYNFLSDRVGLPSRPPAALQARCGNPVRLIVKEVLHPGHTWFLDLLAIWLPYISIWLPTNCKWIHFTLRWEDRRILIDNSCKSRAPKEGYLP